MSDLPGPVAEAGLLFRRPMIAEDPAAMRQLIDWGHQQTDIAYPEDPIRAPVNLIRRMNARREWDRVIRTLGKDLRGTIANQIVRDLEFEFKRRQDDILARDAEQRRREAVTFDGTQRVQEYDVTSQINLRNEKDRLRFSHELAEQAEDNASRRRKEERINETEQQIRLLISQAIQDSMGTSSAQEVLDLVTNITSRISEVRKDKSIDEDDQHIFIKTLLDSLPLMIRKVRDHDL